MFGGSSILTDGRHIHLDAGRAGRAGQTYPLHLQRYGSPMYCVLHVRQRANVLRQAKEVFQCSRDILPL